MQAPELVQKLRDYMENPPHGYAQRYIAEPLADYIEQEICAGSKESYLWRKVEDYLPMIIHRVISEIRETDLEDAGQFTREGRELGYFDVIPDSRLLQDLRYVIEDAVSIEASLSALQLVTAERSLLFATFHCFLRKVYIDGGLRDAILAKPHKSIEKTFGDIKFGCGLEDDRVIVWLWDKTETRGGNVVFSFPTEDTNGLDAHLRSCFATYAIARENIEEVIAKWPMQVSSRS